MTENKKRNKSAVFRGINKIALWLDKKIKTGFIGRLFGAYTKENRAMKNSFAASLIGRRSKVGSFSKKIRFAVAEQFEESRVLYALRKFISFFLGCKLRFYGAFFMTFGVYLGLIYFFKHFFVANEIPSVSYIVISLIMILSSIPMMLSGKVFASKLISSKSGHFIVVDALGISEEKLNISSSKYSDAYNIAIFAGVAAGTLSYFIDPLYIILSVFALISVALIVANPEIGVVAAIAFVPFFSGAENQYLLNAIIFLYSVGYVVKLIRGKRVLNFEIIDLVLVFFAAILMIPGLSSYMGTANGNFRLIFLILGAFFAGNLMRTKGWQKRCAATTVFSGTLAAMLVVLKGVAKIAKAKDLYLLLNNVTLFDNGEILSGFFMISLLFAFGASFYGGGLKKKTVLAFSSTVILISIFMLRSFSAFAGTAIAVLIFFYIMTQKTFGAVLVGGAVCSCAVVYTYEIFPHWITNLFDIMSESFYSMMKIWHGAINLAVASLFSGIGSEGFSHLYPIYSVNGFEGATKSNSLWISLLANIGIVGCVFFVIALFAFAQNCFEYLLTHKNGKRNLFVVSGFAAVIGIIVQSFACDFFVNEAFFYSFWLLVALIGAVIRLECHDVEKNNEIFVNSESSAVIEL